MFDDILKSTEFKNIFIRKIGIQGAAVASFLTYFFVSHLAFLMTGKTNRICLMQWETLVMPFLGVKKLSDGFPDP